MKTKPRSSDKRLFKTAALSPSGFTLIEIMIVMAIIGFMIAIGPAKFFNSSSQLKNEIQKFSPLMRTLRSKARVHNVTYRLVLTFPDDSKKGASKDAEYWVEMVNQNFLVSADDMFQEKEPDKKDEKDGAKPKASFQMDKSIMPQPKSLPHGVKFLDVEYQTPEKVAKVGRAYVYFFPSGLSQESAIHVGNDKDLNWTIYNPPLTGNVEIFSRQIALKDLRLQ